MNVLKKSIVTISLIFSFGASAELVSSDRYSVGDSAAVLDTETGLEWLSLSQTRLANVSGSSLEDKINKVALGNDGWRVATFDEVQSLYLNSFGTLDMTGIGISNPHFSEFLSHFSTSSTFDKHYGLGLYFNDDGEIRSSGTSTWGDGGVLYNVDFFTYRVNNNNTIYNSVYLVSDGGATYSSLNDPEFNAIQNKSVPVPFVLSSLGLIALFVSRRKKLL